MTYWKLPPKAKIYEALSAVADGRVSLEPDGGAVDPAAGHARVVSSDGARTYIVSWVEASGAGMVERAWPAGSAFSSNDNASYWQGYAGYPIIAVLLATGAIDHDPRLAAQLAGVPWREINDRYKRDYDRAVEAVLGEVAAAGGDRHAIAALVDTIHARLHALRLQRGARGAPPPKSNPQP